MREDRIYWNHARGMVSRVSLEAQIMDTDFDDAERDITVSDMMEEIPYRWFEGEAGRTEWNAVRERLHSLLKDLESGKLRNKEVPAT